MAIDSQLQPFIDALEQAWPVSPLTLGVEAWRARAEELSAQNQQPYPAGMQVDDLTIPGGPRPVLVRRYVPAPLVGQDNAPCLLYMHGGGWVIGSHRTHDSITAAIAKEANCVVYSVHYARAPEHPFPAPLEDCQTVLHWLFAHGGEQGVNTKRIFVGGDSAGGNLATVLALENRQHSTHRIRGQVLIYPCVDVNFQRSSYLTEAEAPFLKAKEMIWFWQQYCPDPDKQHDPRVTPMNAPSLKGMPPAIVLVAEHDPLHDEGYDYAQRLLQDEVPVQFHSGRGLIHGYLRATGICSAAAHDFQALCAWIKKWSQ